MIAVFELTDGRYKLRGHKHGAFKVPPGAVRVWFVQEEPDWDHELLDPPYGTRLMHSVDGCVVKDRHSCCEHGAPSWWLVFGFKTKEDQNG